MLDRCLRVVPRARHRGTQRSDDARIARCPRPKARLCGQSLQRCADTRSPKSTESGSPLSVPAAKAGDPLDEVFRVQKAYTVWMQAEKAWSADPSPSNAERRNEARLPKDALWTWAQRETQRGRPRGEAWQMCVALLGTADGLCTMEPTDRD